LKEQFNEAWGNSEQVDPLSEAHYDFPFQEVFERLDGETEDVKQAVWDGMVAVMAILFQHCISDSRQPGGELLVGRRFMACCWVINPGTFDGDSLSRIAKDLHIPARTMQYLAAEASRVLGITNRGQVHGWNRK
jgi:hypothetical protein